MHDARWGRGVVELTNISDKNLFPNAECVTESGAKSGQGCIFPFILNGAVYNGCTLDNAGDNKAWCSVGTDGDGVHINSDWGHCPSSCRMHDGA